MIAISLDKMLFGWKRALCFALLILVMTFPGAMPGKASSGNHTPNNPLIVFSAITGKPTKAQIQKYLDNFKRVGIKQFLIYPRTGMEVEFMSDEYLDICEYMIEYAANNGMSVWLYDEYYCPSGISSGQVIRQNDDFASKKVCVFASEHPTGKVINNVRLKRNYYWSISSIPLYADILNEKAVDAFISLTYEKYYKRFHQYFGNVIKGIFTDEPSPMYALDHKTNGSLLELTWWNGLEEEYHQYTNRDFRSDVEAHLHGITPSNLWPDYFHLLGKRFKSTYLDKISSWCKDHQVVLTGHLMDEITPAASLKANGNPLRAIHSFGMPGIDEIFTKTSVKTTEWVTLGLIENATKVSMAPDALAELFALGPSDMPLAKIRQMIWLTALHGVNHYVLSVAPIDARGNMQKRWYMTFNPTQPWFKALNELGTDAQEATLYAAKESEYKIAVRYPQTITASTYFNADNKKPAFQLAELLGNLCDWQWNPILIEEETKHTSAYDVVLSIDLKGITEEKTDTFFSSFNELSTWLQKNVSRNAWVENLDGNLAKNILLKTFKDNSICAISLSDKPLGKLTLKLDNGKACQFELPEYGIFTYEPGQRSTIAESIFHISPEELLGYELTAPNTMRVFFSESGECEFHSEKVLDNVTVVARKFDNTVSLLADTVSLKLDGNIINTNQACQLLPDEFRNLYQESSKITLAKNEHTLSLAGKKPDYQYLPSAFLFGKFSLKENNVLGKLPTSLSIGSFKNQGLLNYTGDILFKKKATIHNEKYISIDTGGLVCEVFIDGISLGRKVWAPFLWEIPGKCKNKTIDLKILISTSIRPLFGQSKK